MCLLLLALEHHPKYKLILAGNRDEFYDRPTAPASFWEDSPPLLAGRDLRAGGTWLGITPGGRLAAITNFRDPATHREDAPSRGRLITDFLEGREPPVDYLERVRHRGGEYNGFNLVLGNPDEVFWYSNRGPGITKLSPGLHGLSNHLLDTPWPKVTRSKASLVEVLAAQEDPDPEALFDMLLDGSLACDADLPETGVGLEWERILSPIFIMSPTYGTRSSTLLLIDYDNHVTFIERSYNGHKENPETRPFAFTIR